MGSTGGGGQNFYWGTPPASPFEPPLDIAVSCNVVTNKTFGKLWSLESSNVNLLHPSVSAQGSE